MRRIGHFLLAPGTVVFLITALTAACLLATLIPQTATQETGSLATEVSAAQHEFIFDLLGLNRVYTSGWFLALIATTAASLAGTVYRQTRAALAGHPSGNHPLRARQQAGRAGLTQRRSRWGGVLFHLGLLCIILAGLSQAAFQQRGFVVLSEGDLFDGKAASWEVTELGMLAQAFELDFQPRLVNFIPAYDEKGAPAARRSEMTVIAATGEEIRLPLAINAPGRFQRTKIFLSGTHGYTLDLILNEKSAAPILARLQLKLPQQGSNATSRTISFPTTNYQLDLEFYPDLHGKSSRLLSPGADVTIREEGRTPLGGMLAPGDTALLNHGDTLTLGRIGYWTGLVFVRNYGMFLLYPGFVLTLLGSFMIFAHCGGQDPD